MMMTMMNNRRAVRNFSKSNVRDIVPGENTLALE